MSSDSGRITGQIVIRKIVGRIGGAGGSGDGGGAGGGIPDAPSNGSLYARRNGGWAAFDPVEGTGLPDGGTAGQLLAKRTNADGDAEWVAPPSGGGSGGTATDPLFIRYTVGASAADSVIHLNVPVGTLVRSAFASAPHAAQPGRNAPGGGLWSAIAGAPGTLGAIGYDATIKRIVREGAVRRWEFVPEPPIHMAQMGLITGDTAASLGQEALFAIVRDYVLNQNTLQSDNGIVGPKVLGDGIMWTDAGNIDTRSMQWTAGSSFKFFAKNGLKKAGVPVPKAVLRHGRGTSPQNRSTLASDFDGYVEGDQNSTLTNTTTRVVGNEIYDDTGSTSNFRLRANRCYIGSRLRNNSEKLVTFPSGQYNTVLFEYAQVFINLSDYVPAGLTGTALDDAREELAQAIMTDDGDRRGYLGEWNPVLNQQGIASGGYIGSGPKTDGLPTYKASPDVPPLAGAIYKIKLNGTSATVASIDGRTIWDNNKYIAFDGSKWFQARESSDSPDSNTNIMSGQNAEIIFRTPRNGECHGRIMGSHESRMDTGRSYTPYRRVLPTGYQDPFSIAMPGIIDRHGKHMIYGPLTVRAGDQRLLLWSGKDAGVDTSGFYLDTEHVYGCIAWLDWIQKAYGEIVAIGGGNGRYNPGSGAVEAPDYNFVFRVNAVVDGSALSLKSSEAENDIGIVFGDEVRGMFPRGLHLKQVDSTMGGGTRTDPTQMIALQVRASQGLHIPSNALDGKLDFWKDAQGVFLSMPTESMAVCPIVAHLEADVGLRLTGASSASDLFAYDFGNARYCQVESVADERGTGAVWQEGKWEFFSRRPASQLALDSLNSNQNRYFKRASAREMHQSRHVPVFSTGDTATDLWQDSAGVVANTNDPQTGAPAVRLLERTRILVTRHTVAPSSAWINALDRFFFEWTECGMIPLDPTQRGYVDAAWSPWTPTQQAARLNLFGADAADLRLTEVNSANLHWTAYRGYQSSGDNYDADDVFTSVRTDAGYLTTGYNPAVASRGMAINDMHAGAFVLTRHRTNAGEIGSDNDYLYVRGRDTDAAAVQMGVTGMDLRLSSGVSDTGTPPRHTLGIARSATEQRIYSAGRFKAAGVRTAAAMPDAITLLQSAGTAGIGSIRHSPRQLGFAHLGRAIPEAMVRPAIAAIETFYRTVIKLG